MEDANPKKIPSPKDPLGRDLHGRPFSQDFNYAIIVDIMMYLCNNSCTNISFAVNQCARYTQNPIETHATYLKHVGRYLNATHDKGLILNLHQTDLKITCYVYVNFTGL